MSTRTRILDTALELFNDQGSRHVTTNHIAAACGISPGNLYYHFRNKEEIIRALYQRMIESWDRDAPQLTPDRESLLRAIDRGTAVYWEYRFLHLELAALGRQDPELKAMTEAVSGRRRQEIGNFLQLLVANGELSNPGEERLALLTDAIWLISMCWQPYLEMTGRPLEPATIGRAGDIVRMLVEPYIP